MCTLSPYKPIERKPTAPIGPSLNQPAAPVDPMALAEQESLAIAERNRAIAENQANGRQMIDNGGVYTDLGDPKKMPPGRQLIDNGAIGREQPSAKGMAGGYDRLRTDANAAQNAQGRRDQMIGGMGIEGKDAGAQGQAQDQYDAMRGGGQAQAQDRYDNAAADNAFRTAIGESLGVPAKANVPTQVFGAAGLGQKAGARLGATASDSFVSKKPAQTSGRIVE